LDLLGGKILGVTERANYFFGNIDANSTPLIILDILIVSILFFWVYVFLKETRAMRILYGLLFLVVLMAIGRILNLVLLNWILRSLMTVLAVAIPVVFQPELRTALEKLGRMKLLGELAFTKEESERTINEIIKAVNFFALKKIGSLMVIKRQISLRDYIDNGVSLNAVVSSQLLASIFFPKSPLHDGAVIIDGNRIVSASSILPVSQQTLSSSLGTRHKAGLGITEDSDAISIIVSEETGNISLAAGGRLETKISDDRLKNRLIALMRQNK